MRSLTGRGSGSDRVLRLLGRERAPVGNNHLREAADDADGSDGRIPTLQDLDPELRALTSGGSRGSIGPAKAARGSQTSEPMRRAAG